MTKLYGLSALVSPRVASGVGLIALTSLLGGTGCGLSYSLTGLYVEPATGLTCLYPGTTAQYHAYGTYSEGGHTTETKDLTNTVAWTVTIPDLASMNASGLATAGSDFVGPTSIVATAEGEFGQLNAVSSLQVSTTCSTSSSVKPSLRIIPGSQTLAAGDKERPMAIAFSNGGAATDMTGKVTWESSDVHVATIDRTGLIAAVGAGDATITATGKTANGEAIAATQTVHFTANN